MTTTLRIGNGTELHLVDENEIILSTLGQLPLCGSARINNRKAKITVFEGQEATCTKCLKRAEKLGK